VIYTIPRYPVHLIDVLAVGTRRVTVRPTLPQDIELQRAFFRGLSPCARDYRFLTPLPELPTTLVESFANIDYSRHLALLAEVFEAGRQRMIGEARYIVDAGDPAVCEFALAIADDWQGQGLGGFLLARLERQAAASGVGRMTAETLIINRPMLRLARRAGYSVSVGAADAGHVHLEKSFTDQTDAADLSLSTPSKTAA
jgi:acetyltransferase